MATPYMPYTRNICIGDVVVIKEDNIFSILGHWIRW